MRAKLTPAFIKEATCPAHKKREYFWDTSMPGFGLLVTSTGHRSFVAQNRLSRGRSPRKTFKGTLPLRTARREAKRFLGEVARGIDPLEARRKAAREAEGTFLHIAENFFKREGPKLRSAKERRRTLERLVYPAFGSRQFASITRRDYIALLDKIADQNGPRMADLTLAYLNRLCNWHAIRDDSFRSPIVRGMTRVNAKAHARSRILSDDELRAVWKTAEESTGAFGPLLKYILLTACRRNEGSHVTRAEVVGGVWTIPAERYKTKIDHAIPLSDAARAVLVSLPQIGDCNFYFTVRGTGPIRALARFKARFDVACGVTGWTLHDLRRTARSLMSRAGVNADIAEMCLGHTLGGIRGVYDRHEYLEEKRFAFEKLATQIEGIVNPRENVLPLRGGAS